MSTSPSLILLNSPTFVSFCSFNSLAARLSVLPLHCKPDKRLVNFRLFHWLSHHAPVSIAHALIYDTSLIEDNGKEKVQGEE